MGAVAVVLPVVAKGGDDASLFQQVVATGAPLIPGITRLGAGRLFGTTKLFHMGEFIHLAGLGFAADLALVLFLALFHASGSLGQMPVVELVVARGVNKIIPVFMVGVVGTDVLIVALCATGGGHRGLYIVMCVGVDGDGLLPSAVTTVVGCSVRLLIVASIICRARFSAGGLLGNVLG